MRRADKVARAPSHKAAPAQEHINAALKDAAEDAAWEAFFAARPDRPGDAWDTLDPEAQRWLVAEAAECIEHDEAAWDRVIQDAMRRADQAVRAARAWHEDVRLAEALGK